jgi:hypothetical protein
MWVNARMPARIQHPRVAYTIQSLEIPMTNVQRSLMLAAALAPSLVLADGLSDALGKTKLGVDLRYRLESVSQDGFAEDALASTLRLRLGATSGEVRGFSATVEFEVTGVVGPADYNDTVNGKVQYPQVSDPADDELDQAFLQWQHDDWKLRYGRQRLTLGNHRFVGNVGFRQNEQTFDATSLAGKLGPGTLSAAILENANRVFGAHNPSSTLANTPLEGGYLDYGLPLGPGRLTAYAHFFEFEASLASSHQNLGLRYAGDAPLGEGKLRFAFEYAKQDDYADGAATIDQDYRLLEGGYGWERIGFRVGQEVLGGDGTRGFQTPFATLHAFNGWADRFLTTPANGLTDRYLKLDGKRGQLTGYFAWHGFTSDAADLDYGTEFDLGLTWQHDARTAFKLELAHYDADSFATDTRILWLTAEYKL